MQGDILWDSSYPHVSRAAHFGQHSNLNQDHRIKNLQKWWALSGVLVQDDSSPKNHIKKVVRNTYVQAFNKHMSSIALHGQRNDEGIDTDFYLSQCEICNESMTPPTHKEKDIIKIQRLQR